MPASHGRPIAIVGVALRGDPFFQPHISCRKGRPRRAAPTIAANYSLFAMLQLLASEHSPVLKAKTHPSCNVPCLIVLTQ